MKRRSLAIIKEYEFAFTLAENAFMKYITTSNVSFNADCDVESITGLLLQNGTEPKEALDMLHEMAEQSRVAEEVEGKFMIFQCVVRASPDRRVPMHAIESLAENIAETLDTNSVTGIVMTRTNTPVMAIVNPFKREESGVFAGIRKEVYFDGLERQIVSFKAMESPNYGENKNLEGGEQDPEILELLGIDIFPSWEYEVDTTDEIEATAFYLWDIFNRVIIKEA